MRTTEDHALIEELFEDWFQAIYTLAYEVPRSCSLRDLLLNAKARASRLGIQWLHEEKLREQDGMEW